MTKISTAQLLQTLGFTRGCFWFINEFEGLSQIMSERARKEIKL